MSVTIVASQVDMLTIGFFPSSGLNTIRVASKKYQEMSPGDRVLMEYVCPGTGTRGNPKGQLLAKEKLEVKHIAYVPKDLLDEYFGDNHAKFDGLFGRAITDLDLWAMLRSYYGDEVMDDPATLFAVITFA